MVAQTLWPCLPEEAVVARSTTIVVVVEELSEEATLSVVGRCHVTENAVALSAPDVPNADQYVTHGPPDAKGNASHH